MNSEYQSGSYQSYKLKNNKNSTQPENKYTKAAGSITGILILVIIAIIICAIIAGVNNSNLETLTSEYNYYVNLAERAQIDPDYQAEATIIGRYYDSNTNKYYLEYEIPLNEYNTLYGSTPKIYHAQDLNYYNVGDTIKVALSEKKDSMGIFTDTVNLNINTYMLFNYEDYSSVNNTYTISSTLAIIFGTVGIVLLITIIILKSIGGKNHLLIPNTSNPPTIHTSNLHNYCLYCNGNLADGRDKGKCPNCGAPTSRR
ncbi:MAG: hypothetical protein E7354_05445 [Clostridiales bacterium]|nr:hypothetical protein [Clostridiales bacterium]